MCIYKHTRTHTKSTALLFVCGWFFTILFGIRLPPRHIYSSHTHTHEYNVYLYWNVIFFFSFYYLLLALCCGIFFLLIFSSHTEKDSHDIRILENVPKLLLHYTHIWDVFTHIHIHTRICIQPSATHYRYIILLLLLLYVCSHETDFGFDAERFSSAKCSNHSNRIVCPIVKSI